jgi:5-methylthioadenosine/S-adenosylhomocysteine deaminase
MSGRPILPRVPSKHQSRAPRKARRKTGSVMVLKGGYVISVDEKDHVGRLDLRIEEGRITEIGERVSESHAAQIIDCRHLVVLPGFVQAHIHLCHTLFRAHAESMTLLDWLRERIWPLEGALSADDLRMSARLGLCELLLSGTTSILDMGTVLHTDVLFEEARDFGIRYTGGKAIMDRGQGYPAALRETTSQAITESVRLCRKWHNTENGRLRYAFSPRFVLSCSDEVLKACALEARRAGALLHSHASESADEVALVRERTGMGNVECLHRLGFSGRDVVLAHGVWLGAEEHTILRETQTSIAHCPSANLKLASGIARIDELLKQGVRVALGTDGAACNNGLDAFFEMRLAALLHRVRGGPSAVSAAQALRLATRAGAEALGLFDTGQISVGKWADLVLVDLHKPHTFPDSGDLISRVVFSARPSDVHTVMVAGKVLVREGRLVGVSLEAVLREAAQAAERVRARI